jgi:hypothetical protein
VPSFANGAEWNANIANGERWRATATKAKESQHYYIEKPPLLGGGIAALGGK